ncbi:hypothetical protein L1987_62151 [Smallanthus sonchifolius]|uniref:Uncharacterized protein n=1 Tax=Smallanthus sonchifolius TaxID=185202 RepID=A0ACB9C9K7_9ASTR|nr:hypothetical protein L1987_62151 [Smallanthus sonchifolius]
MVSSGECFRSGCTILVSFVDAVFSSRLTHIITTFSSAFLNQFRFPKWDSSNGETLTETLNQQFTTFSSSSSSS